MAIPAFDTSSVIEPLRQLVRSGQPGVLAVITKIEGPSYRPLGAMMAVFEDSRRVGTLSSGCIEADISLHALGALKEGQTKTIRYGIGSPFVDIQLPCGGGLEITLIPRPDREVMEAIFQTHNQRVPTGLQIDLTTGVLGLSRGAKTGLEGDQFHVRIDPEIFFYVFGKGPEAITFTGLVQAAGYPHLLLSPDAETVALVDQAKGHARHITTAYLPADLTVDRFSAVLLFFHDHEWEPPILRDALNTPAFFIGAQGSKRAAEVRMAQLEELGVPEGALARLKGPVGLIPSVRDARKLAVSVLADVLNEA